MHWLTQLIAPVSHVLFVIGADHVSVAELAGFVTGAACVWLTVKAHIANFPVGLANDAFFLVLFLAAGLYADSGLQVVYLVLGVVGWWQWLRGGENRERLEAGRATVTELGVLAALVVLATWGLTVPLYGLKHLRLTAVVYAVFLAMCFVGYGEWRRALQRPAQFGGLALATEALE
jgi:nicotinamide mononucleotide transporter